MTVTEQNSMLFEAMDQSDMPFRTADKSEELKRLATFSGWPDGDTPSPLAFARYGFIYSGDGFKVKCPLCGLELENLERGDNPAEEHRKRSPYCHFVTQLPASSHFPSPVDLVLSEERGNESSLLDVYNDAVRRFINQNRRNVGATNSFMQVVRIDRENPDYELLRQEKCRLDTFYDWPSAANTKPEELARDGFFYTGSTDKVRCAFCRNALHNWAPGDIPREEHKKHFPRCPFVLDFNIANLNIGDKVPLENSSVTSPSVASFLPGSAGQQGQNSELFLSADTYMNTTTVRAIVEMGFSLENVKQTVQQQLHETGRFFPNAESLLEKLLLNGFDQSPVRTQSNAEAAIVATHPEPNSGTKTTVETGTLQNTISGSSKQGNSCAEKNNQGGKTELGSFTSQNAEIGEPILKERTNCTVSSAAAAAAAVASSETGKEHSSLYSYLEEQQMLEENFQLKEARTCKVCMDKEVNTVFLPCGHLICCEVCAAEVRNCPLCRTFIRGTVRTYLS